MVCLEGLGKLAQKFPNIASTSIYYLRDFLVVPSPILLKLHRQQSEKGGIKFLINILYCNVVLHNCMQYEKFFFL